MKKIPTMFERDWSDTTRRVIDKIKPGCEWVSQGDGLATKKLDGTSCMVSNGALFKRRELRDGDPLPPAFQLVGRDDETRKTVGWVPVGDAPEDRWHREAFARGMFSDGTYELVGPKVQGNPENISEHTLIPHSDTGVYQDAPRTFEGLRRFLQGMDIEGLVFHHPDGRMAKIKQRDFGLKRH